MNNTTLTSITDFAESYDKSVSELRILMNIQESDFASAETDDNGVLQLPPSAVDALEAIVMDESHHEIPLKWVSQETKIASDIIYDHCKQIKAIIKSKDAETADDYRVRCGLLSELLTTIQSIPETAATKKPDSAPELVATIATTETEISEPEPTVTVTKIAETNPADEPLPEPKSEEPKKKPVRKKKNKYAIPANQFLDYLQGTGNPDIAIKNLRLFALATGELKPDEIAVMSDAEIERFVYQTYVPIMCPSGILLVNKSMLSAVEQVYMIPYSD